MQRQSRYTTASNTTWRILAVFAACMVAAVVWRFQAESSKPTLATTSSTASTQPQPILRNDENKKAISEEELKPLAATPKTLEDSDSDVIAAANDLAPQLVQWLTPDEQIRKWVALIDQIADKKIPQYHRPLDYPVTSFEAERDGNKLSLNTSNYQRADWLIGVVTDISPVRLAHYYHEWRPSLEKAHKELGMSGSFDKQLRRAIQNVVAVKPLSATPELIRVDVFYVYADPNLEKASDVEKLMWRMGPDNMKKLQHFLGELDQLL